MEQEELEAEYNARYGDPRRCPVHGVAISSPDGMFDAPCWECEGEMEYEVEAANAFEEPPPKVVVENDDQDPF